MEPKEDIIDFGIVRFLDMESLTQTSQRFGPCTPGYGAPEQMRNLKAQINIRADLFSVGVVAYEALKGHNPYTRDKRDILEIRYRKWAIAYGRANEACVASRTNKALDALMEVRAALRRASADHEHEIRDRLLELLGDDDLFVRLSAGIDALRFSPDDAVAVLEAIAQRPTGMVSHEAAMVLKLWRKGEFTVPWWDE